MTTLSLSQMLSNSDLSGFYHTAAEMGLRALLIVTLLISVGLIAIRLLRLRSANERSYLIKAIYIATIPCLLVPFLSAVQLPTIWTVSLPQVAFTAGVPLNGPTSIAEPTVSNRRKDIAPSGSANLASQQPVSSTSDDMLVKLAATTMPARLYEISVTAWLVGILWHLVHLAISVHRLRRLQEAPAAPESTCRANRLLEIRCSSMSAPRPFPKILFRSEIPSAFLVQMPLSSRSATIVLPAHYGDDLDDAALNSVLSHELAHWRRRDCEWFFVAYIVGAFLWFHPMLFFLCRCFKETCEDACDESVLADGYSSSVYASLLVKLAAQYASNAIPARQLAVAPGILVNPPVLERRIRNIMKHQHLGTLSDRWLRLPLYSRALVAGGLSFVVVSGIALFNRPPSAPDANYTGPVEVIDAAHPKYLGPTVNQFPRDLQMPDGTVSLKDVEFTRPESLLPSVPILLVARYNGGTLRIVELPKYRSASGRPVGHETVIWTGPIENANFELETVAGLHTLRNATGRAIWSDASTMPTPDLQLLRDSDGQSRLLGKGGILFWSGHLDQDASGGTLMSSGAPMPVMKNGRLEVTTGFNYDIRERSVHIVGSNGAFTVMDSRGVRLWSGKLPVRPVVLVHDGRRFAFTYGGVCEGGSDFSVRVRFEGESGSAQIEDRNHRLLGARQVDILRTMTALTPTLTDRSAAGTRRANTWQVGYSEAKADLTAPGTVFVTYLDNKGSARRRVEVYRLKGALKSGSRS